MSLSQMAALQAYPHSSLQDAAVGIIFAFAMLSLVVVCLRVYSKILKNQIGFDDILVCIAMVFEIGQTVTSYMCIRTMFVGIHLSEMIASGITMETGMLWNFAAQLVYNPILACVKCSVLVFLLRLGGGLERKTRWCIYGVGTITLVQMIIIFLVLCLQCRPLHYYWAQYGQSPPQGSCFNLPIFYISTAAVTVLTDLLVLALPVWIFVGLKMRASLKAMVIGLFLLGGGATVISILRLVWLINLYYYPVADSTYDISFVYVEIETCLAIIASCGPSLKPLVVGWFPSLFDSSRGPRDRPEDYEHDGRTFTTGVKSSRDRTRQSVVAGTHSFAMKDFGRGGEREIREDSPTGSEEEIMTYHGIMRMREYTVTYAKHGGIGGVEKIEG